MTNLLLDKGADPNSLTDPFQLTPLHVAAKSGMSNVMETLVRFEL